MSKFIIDLKDYYNYSVGYRTKFVNFLSFNIDFSDL